MALLSFRTPFLGALKGLQGRISNNSVSVAIPRNVPNTYVPPFVTQVKPTQHVNAFTGVITSNSTILKEQFQALRVDFKTDLNKAVNDISQKTAHRIDTVEFNFNTAMQGINKSIIETDEKINNIENDMKRMTRKIECRDAIVRRLAGEQMLDIAKS